MSRWESISIDRRAAYFRKSADERAKSGWAWDWRYENGKKVIARALAGPKKQPAPNVITPKRWRHGG